MTNDNEPPVTRYELARVLGVVGLMMGELVEAAAPNDPEARARWSAALDRMATLAAGIPNDEAMLLGWVVAQLRVSAGKG